MRWLIKKVSIRILEASERTNIRPSSTQGDILREDVPLSEPLCCQQLISQGPFQDLLSTVYVYDENEAEDPPTDPNVRKSKCTLRLLPVSNINKIPAGVRPHVFLTSALSLIPKKKLMQRTGKDKKKYYEIMFEVRTNFFSAHTEYSMWYEDVRYGKVDAEYE